MSNCADAGTLANVASVIGAFGAAMLFFRLQRENEVRERGGRAWFPLADWLLVMATALCFLLVILPLILSKDVKLPGAAAGAAAIMVTGYIFAILAH